MRIRIALCDNDSKALPIVAGAVDASFQAHGFQTDIHRFQEASALLSALEETHYQLLLLGIEMPDMDGIELAQKIRASSIDAQIVFVSEAESRVFEAFQVQPLGFVRKSHFLGDVSAVVELFLKTLEQKKKDEYLEFTTRTGLLLLRSRQVSFIEGSRNYQLLNVEGRSNPVVLKMTMDKLEQMTSPLGFIRIHKGFLVNYQHIQQLSSTTAVLQNGVTLPIGRSKAQEAKRKYLSLIEK
ncbi:MAG: response regulator transcription factor [Clostridia bacterium]|nr:response regulator transcription factor [Clostridia bacterium]